MKERKRLTDDIAQRTIDGVTDKQRAQLSERETEHLASLIAAKYPSYYDRYKGRYDAFTEAMTRNWIAKENAFMEIARRFGLKDIITSDRNDYTFAALTVNSSFVLIGSNSMAPNSQGARVLYQPIDSLSEDKRVAKMYEKGGYMTAIPTLHTSLRMSIRRDDPEHPLGPFEPLASSQIIRLCAGKVKNVPAFFTQFPQAIPDVYAAIDRLTITQRS